MSHIPYDIPDDAAQRRALRLSQEQSYVITPRGYPRLYSRSTWEILYRARDQVAAVFPLPKDREPRLLLHQLNNLARDGMITNGRRPELTYGGYVAL